MFTTRAPDETFEYISIQDPAVKDGEMSPEAIGRYAETGDMSLLVLNEKLKPTRFIMAKFCGADKRYLFGGDGTGEAKEERDARLDAAIVAVGLRGWIDPQKGAPLFTTKRVGFHRVASDAVLDSLGTELGKELAMVLWLRNFEDVDTGATLAEEVEKN